MDIATPLLMGQRASARAFLLGDRIDTGGLERTRELGPGGGQVLSTAPLAFRAGGNGIAVVLRYGAVVLIGLTAAEQEQFLANIRGRVAREYGLRDEEGAAVEISEGDDQIPPGGPIGVKSMSVERLLVIADALAKSVALAHDEREVASVFDQIEPFAGALARHGRTPGGRRAMLRHIGNALLVKHRISGRVAVGEKPDVLWDRPDLERLYARLEDEYELKERAGVLDRKLAVIAETAQALTDIIDTERSLRLEVLIVLLFAFEIALAFWRR
jgi:uncharacterized Rmd1/YagE family protein